MGEGSLRNPLLGKPLAWNSEGIAEATHDETEAKPKFLRLSLCLTNIFRAIAMTKQTPPISKVQVPLLSAIDVSLLLQNGAVHFAGIFLGTDSILMSRLPDALHTIIQALLSCSYSNSEYRSN